MPSKTAARSGSRTSRSKATSRSSGSRGARPAAPRGKPGRPTRRRQHPPLVAAGLTCGRALRAGWMLAARGTGGAARSIGRARDIDPGHRRDGIALLLLGFSVVVAASSWFHAAGPVGAWVDTALRTFIGAGVLALPVVTAAVAVTLMRTEPDPDVRPRLILGAGLIALSVLGLRHLWSGSPGDPDARRRAAGFIGFAIGGPLSDGLTPWIAAPLLFIGFMFGLLLLTGTTIRELPVVMRNLFHTRFVEDYTDEDYTDEDYGDEPYDYAGEFDDAAAQPEPEPAGWAPDDDAQAARQDDIPTVPEPAVKTGRGRKRGRAADNSDTIELDRVVEDPTCCRR